MPGINFKTYKRSLRAFHTLVCAFRQTSWFRNSKQPSLSDDDVRTSMCRSSARRMARSRRSADVPLRQCGMTLLKCSHVCRVHRSSLHTAQSIRLRGVHPALGRRSSLRVRAASAAGTQGAEGNVIQEGPRCYLEPTDNGQGLVEICVSEGRLDIGVADSDYYFTAFTGRQGDVFSYWSHGQAVVPCLHCRHDFLTVQCALQCQRGN